MSTIRVKIFFAKNQIFYVKSIEKILYLVYNRNEPK